MKLYLLGWYGVYEWDKVGIVDNPEMAEKWKAIDPRDHFYEEIKLNQIEWPTSIPEKKRF